MTFRHEFRCTAPVWTCLRPNPCRHQKRCFSETGWATGCSSAMQKANPRMNLSCCARELCAVPSFEFALNERLWLVERFDNPTFLIVRNVVRLPGRLPRISLLSDYTGGTRLSDVLARAEANKQLISAGAAVFVIKEILEALADLHRQSGDLSHGALAPERIVLADGRVRIADYVLGAAIEQLRYSGRSLLEGVARGGAGLGRQRSTGSARRRCAGRDDRDGVDREPPAARFGKHDGRRRYFGERVGRPPDSKLAIESAPPGLAARICERGRSAAGSRRGHRRSRPPFDATRSGSARHEAGPSTELGADPTTELGTGPSTPARSLPTAGRKAARCRTRRRFPPGRRWSEAAHYGEAATRCSGHEERG